MTLAGTCHEVRVATLSRHCIAMAIISKCLLTSTPVWCVWWYTMQLLGHCTCHLIVELFMCKSFSLVCGMHPIIADSLHDVPTTCSVFDAVCTSSLTYCILYCYGPAVPYSILVKYENGQFAQGTYVGMHMWCCDSFSESTSHVNKNQSDFSAIPRLHSSITTICWSKWDDQLSICSFMMWTALYSGICMTLNLPNVLVFLLPFPSTHMHHPFHHATTTGMLCSHS